MMDRKVALLACLAAGLAGCGVSSYSTKVLETGQDSYTVAADDLSAPLVMQSAVGQAQVHCGSLSREIVMTERNARTVGERNVYEVAFRCLAKGDPELPTRPTRP